MILPVLSRPERVLARTRAFCERVRDPALSALLIVELLLMFVVIPLGTAISEVPALLLVPFTLVLVLVLASHRLGALVVATMAVGLRVVAGILELRDATISTDVIDTISAILALLAVSWVVFGIVFSPGRITYHRVRGAIVLYLTIAFLFAWIFRLIAGLVPHAFSGLVLYPGHILSLNGFDYYSLTVLTTLGFGDITPIHAFARSMTTLEAVIGQLYPPIILARILTLYAEEASRDR